MGKYVADFETTTTKEDCRVWAYAVTEVGNPENIIIGTTIDEFMKWCEEEPDNHLVFFHNLKFDCQFILYWLFHHGFQHVEQKDRASNTFTTLISDKGLYYQMEVIFKLKGKKVKKVTFQDSLKLIPLSVDAIGKAFKLPMQKGVIDYGRHNTLPAGSPLSDEEKEYIKNDVQIVAHAIDYFHSQGLDRMTIGACALEEYKKLIKKRNFKNWFPTPQYYEDVKQSYKGGFTYLNPKFTGRTVKNGIVLDVNSLYPSVMYDNYLPYGTPLYYEGDYQEDPLYPLYIQQFTCSFELKSGKIPTIQLKKSMFGFSETEYLLSSDHQEVPVCLTSVDLKLFFEHYHVYNYTPIAGWKFKATKGLFTEYIDKWSNNKIEAKKDGNHGLYLISKLFLNSLYGKFGTSTTVKSKIPYLDKDADVVKFYDSDVKSKDGVYIAMASFITSYARLKTISSAQRITDDYNAGKSSIQFVYADTDSLHCVSDDFSLPEGLDIDSTKLGAWDFEAKFSRAKFLRAKCYIENHIIDEEEYNKGKQSENHFMYKMSRGFHTVLKVTVAGMPKACHRQVTFNNFIIGAQYKGKLQPKIVTGGVVLNDVDFTIKRG